MPRKILVLILVLIGLELNGQTGPVFSYDNPSKQKLYNLASENSPKGEAYLSYMVEAVNFGLKDTLFKVSNDPEFIASHLFWEEIYLNEGGYMNSGYDSVSQKINPSVGHSWKGFGWVFRIGSHSIPLIKGDCGNIVKIIPTAVIKKEETAKTPSTPNSFGLKPAPNLFPQGLSNVNQQQSVPPVNVFVTNTNTVDFGPLIDALGKINQPPAQSAADLKLPVTVDENKPTWWDKNGDKVVIGGLVLASAGTIVGILLKEKKGPVGAPGHDDNVLLKLAFLFNFKK